MTSDTTTTTDDFVPPPSICSRFIALPREVRDKISAYAVSLPKHIVVPNRSGAETPALARVNRMLRAEVVPIYYEINTFTPLHIGNFKLWLPMHATELVTKVYVDLWSSTKLSFTLRYFGFVPKSTTTCCSKGQNHDIGKEFDVDVKWVRSDSTEGALTDAQLHELLDAELKKLAHIAEQF